MNYEARRMVALAISFIRLSFIDFSTGNDLESLKADTFEKCEQACEYNQNCKGYVYNPNTYGCWLKDNLNGMRELDFTVNVGLKVDKI